MTARDESRFWSKVAPTGFCWNWEAAVSNGYGRFSISATPERKKHSVYVHRYAYEILTQEQIPAGYQVDHLCRNTVCVSPDHLEPVPGIVNNRRSYSSTGVNGRKQFCVRGHEFTPDNTKHDGKGRVCMKCRKYHSDMRRKEFSKETV